MILRPPISTRPDTLFPDTTLVGAVARVLAGAKADHCDPPDTAIADADLDRGGVAQVDDAAIVERAAIVDPHHHRLAVVQVGHPGEARQRQRFVRRGERVHVVHPDVRGAEAVELVAVIRSRSEESRVGKKWVTTGKSKGTS